MKNYHYSILFQASAILGIFMIFCGCDGGSHSYNPPRTTEELKDDLKTREEISPLSYLQLRDVHLSKNITQERGLLKREKSDGYVIIGNVINSATLANYKDVVLLFEYFSQTNTKIDEVRVVLYEFFPPNQATPITVRLKYIPSAMANYNCTIIQAAPVINQ